MSDYTFYQPGMEKFGPVSGIGSSNGHPSLFHNLINVDGHGSDLSFDNDDYIDFCSEHYMDVDEYDLLQAQFDNVDIPPGVEAPFNWLPEYELGLKKTGNSTSSPLCDMQSYAKYSHVTYSSQPSRLLEPSNSKIQGSQMGNSNLQIKMGNAGHSSGTELSPQLFSQAAPSKKKSAASQRSGRGLNHSLGVESSKSQWFLKSFHSKMKSAFFGSKNHGSVKNPEVTKLQHAGKPPYVWQPKSANKAAGSSSSHHSNFIGENPGKNSHNFNPLSTNHTTNPNYYPLDPPNAAPKHMFDSTWNHNSARDGNNVRAVDPPVSTMSDQNRDKRLREFQNFKQFDTVNDASSDHHYIRNNSSTKQVTSFFFFFSFKDTLHFSSNLNYMGLR